MSSKRYLRFGQKPDHTILKSETRTILWPVFVHTVTCSSRIPGVVNPFQATIMGLIRAGKKEVREIADAMKLDAALVEFIASGQLKPRFYVDFDRWKRLILTPKGAEVLDMYANTHDSEESHEHRLAYMFRDGITGEWFPRLAFTLNEAEPVRFTMDGQERPVFLLNRDSGKEIKPFELKHASDLPPGNNIQSAFDRWKEDVQYTRYDDLNAREACLIDCPTLDEQDPVRMWLWTIIQNDPKAPDGWKVTDPLELSPEALWMKPWIRQACSQNPGLASRMRGLMRGDDSERNDGLNIWIDKIAKQIDLDIQADYPWARHVPDVRKHLAQVLRTSRLVEDQPDSSAGGRQNRPLQENLASLLTESAKLAESVLHWMLKRYPCNQGRFPGAQPAATSSKHGKQHALGQWTHKEMQEALDRLELPWLDQNSIRRLAGQTPPYVRKALNGGAAPLQPLVLACLFATIDVDGHPFRNCKDMNMKKLFELADMRNRRGAHASKHLIERATALDLARFAVDWTASFKNSFAGKEY